MIAFATAIEALRIANRMLNYDSYKWRLASLDGNPVLTVVRDHLLTVSVQLGLKLRDNIGHWLDATNILQTDLTKSHV